MLVQLGRRKGRLVNKAVEGNSRKGVFVCDCDCGNTDVIVDTLSFNNGNVTACPECVSKGLSVKMYPNNPRRIMFSVDPEPAVALGYDPADMNSADVRTLLREYAESVKLVSRSIDRTPKQWQALLKGVEQKPHLLQSDATPEAKLLQIANEAGAGEWTLPPMQTLAVLAALRWGLDHPTDRWWDVDERTSN